MIYDLNRAQSVFKQCARRELVAHLPAFASAARICISKFRNAPLIERVAGVAPVVSALSPTGQAARYFIAIG